MIRKAFLLFTVTFMMFVSYAYASVSPDYLPQVQTSFNQDSESEIKVGQDEYGGVCFVMPDGHKDMVITFYWEKGGVIDFYFYDYSGKLVWDSRDDAPFYNPKRYAVYSDQPVRTYEVGSNVHKIVAYCSHSDKVCTTSINIGSGFSFGDDNNATGNSIFGRTCSESYYYASMKYGNVREK